MFDNIAQIEKEVQEFRTNILASKELLQRLEDLTEAVTKEHKALVGKMTDLQASVEEHTTDNTQRVSASVDSLLKGYEKAAGDLTTEIHTSVEKLRQGNAEDLSRLQDEVCAAADKNLENLRIVSGKYEEYIAKAIEKISTLQVSIVQHTTDNTQRVSDSVDSLLKGHEKAAGDLATEIHTSVEKLRQGNAEDLSRLQAEMNVATDKNSESIRFITQKIDEFLVKIESSNLEHIYEYCAKLEHSMNQKFMILGIGIGITTVLAILSIIL